MTKPWQLDCATRKTAVAAFDSHYAEMERALWCLSKHCREPLLTGTSTPVVEALVWTVKSWWGVQGVVSPSKGQIAAALAARPWSPDVFEASVMDPEWATLQVTTLVRRSMALGVPRQEFSLCSKVLHWLMPWLIPVFDAFACKSLGIPSGWTADRAYPVLAERVMLAAQATAEDGCDWLGSAGPASPLRGFDKLLWWSGGGDVGTAVVVKDPGQVLRRLGIDLSHY